MKMVAIESKAKANKAQVESLFTAGGTLVKEKYCGGKYAHSCIGREVEVSDDVAALWTERRKDRDGPYYTLYAMVRPKQD